MTTRARLLHDLVDAAAARWPDRVALRHRAAAMTYAQLRMRSLETAAALVARGVGRGERVVVGLPDVIAVVAVLFGASRIGAIHVVTSPGITQYAATHILRDCRPAIVVCRAGSDLEGWATALGIPTADPGGWQGPVEVPLAVRPAISMDPVGILYTSGSTGRPKGVVAAHRNVLFALDAIAARLELRADDVIGCVLPVDFDYGLYQIFLGLACGARVVWGERVDAGPRLLSFLSRNAITVLPAVPGLARNLLKLSRRDPTSRPPLRVVTNTGAAMSPDLIRQLRAEYPAAGIYPMFGLTECKRVSILLPGEIDDRPGSVGRPLDDTECLIVDPASDEPCPPGTVGELVVRGPHVMRGYWSDETASAMRFRTYGPTGERALFTGDRCWLDADGYLYFAGRDDDLFKVDGYRVSAAEVALAAEDIAGVVDACCLPRRNGEPSVLAVVTDLEVERVRRELGARLQPYQMPDRIQRVGELPTRTNGKVDRGALAGVLAREAFSESRE